MVKGSHPLYLAHTLPGFEAIAVQEITRQLAGVNVQGTRTIADKNGIVLYEHAGDVQELLALHTLEDHFVVVAKISSLPKSREALRLLEDAAARSTAFELALNIARRARPGRRIGGKIGFRVVARQVETAAYRRVDAQRAVERGIMARKDHKWRLDETGLLEFWLTLLRDEAYLALRLSDEGTRHRAYKVEHIPGSLRPSAAAAMAWLTMPRQDDVFLDPMCGAGTILIERANMSRYRLLLGGDIRDEAITATLRNIGTRFKPIEVRQWDARALPLDAGLINALAVNLPFGNKIGTVEENRVLYPAFLREAARVLAPRSRLVALTGDERTFVRALQRTSGLEPCAEYSVHVLGRPAKVFVAQRV